MGLRSLVATGPAVVVAGLFAASVSSNAYADEPALVRVVVPACDASAFDIEVFSRAITLELRADGVEKVDIGTERGPPPAAPTGAVATIRIEAAPCTAEARAVDVIIVDQLTRKTVERHLTIDDLAPGARPRVLALAAAELLRASWTELRLPDAPKGALPVPAAIRLASMEPARPAEAPATPVTPLSSPVPVAAVPGAPEVRADARVSRWLRTDVALVSRFFPTYGTAVVGPGLAVSFGAADRVPLRLRVDASALFGTSYDPLGSISVHLVTGGAALVLAHDAGPLDVEIGPRLEVAWGEAVGNPTSATTTASSAAAPVVDASVMLGLRLSLGGAYCALVAADLGEVIAGLDAVAEGRRAAGFGGLVVGAAFGVGRSF